MSNAASNPGAFLSRTASGAAQSAVKNWNMLNNGSDSEQEQAIANWLKLSGTVIAGPAARAASAASEVPQVLINQAAGNAFRDATAAAMKQAGYDVQTEVYKSTGLGARYIDIDVSKNGVNLGGIETKVGSSPYTTAQRAKDAWLRYTSDYIVNVIRQNN